MFYNTFQSASAALEKLSGVLEEEPDVPEPTHPVPLHDVRGDVRFDRVRFEYVEGVPVLPDMDLVVPAGQTLALVGTTGAGKTTLAKLATRFYDPLAGRVLLDGIDLRQFFEPMMEISQFYNTFQSASAALEKLSGVLEEEPSVPS